MTHENKKDMWQNNLIPEIEEDQKKANIDEWLKFPLKMLPYNVFQDIITELQLHKVGLLYIKAHYKDLFNIPYAYDPTARDMLMRVSVLERVTIGEFIKVLRQIERSDLEAKIYEANVADTLIKSNGTFIDKKITDLEMHIRTRVIFQLSFSTKWIEFATLVGLNTVEIIRECLSTSRPAEAILLRWQRREDATVENLNNAFIQLKMKNACALLERYRLSNIMYIGLEEKDMRIRVVKNQRCNYFRNLFCF